jgi:acid phosphatase (class A)
MLQVRNDADYFIQRLKIDFPRQRPFLYVPGLEPCVLKEVTGAYPSGHAAISRLQALILSRLYPERSQALFARARAIGQSRVLSGMHHPSDIRAGEELAEKLYGEFGKSESFQRALRALEQRPF